MILQPRLIFIAGTTQVEKMNEKKPRRWVVIKKRNSTLSILWNNRVCFRGISKGSTLSITGVYSCVTFYNLCCIRKILILNGIDTLREVRTWPIMLNFALARLIVLLISVSLFASTVICVPK